MEQKFLNYFKFYLTVLLSFAIFWLYLKHTVGNDSTISEWIINYQGGFTRRGLPGEVAFQIASFFELKLRFVIFMMQVIFYSIYIFLVYKYFKTVKINLIILFTIFTPIFLIYHIAELEVLVRKEIFLFIGYLWFYNISKKENHISQSIIWIIFILPIISLLYEPAFFYYSFFAATIFIKLRNEKISKILIFVILIFLPSIIISWFSAFTLISPEGFELMKNSLSEKFGEACYMSCGLMSTKKEAIVHIKATIGKLTESDYSIFRYFLILLIGFLPLLILIKNSIIKITIFKFKKLIIPFLILNIMVPVHWLMFIDWGRAVNITYISSLFFFFYLYKNKYINVNFKAIDKKINKLLSTISNKTIFKSKKSIIVFTFIIYAFGWSPPTLLSADVNSFPGYRIPYKTIKFLFLN